MIFLCESVKNETEMSFQRWKSSKSSKSEGEREIKGERTYRIWCPHITMNEVALIIYLLMEQLETLIQMWNALNVFDSERLVSSRFKCCFLFYSLFWTKINMRFGEREKNKKNQLVSIICWCQVLYLEIRIQSIHIRKQQMLSSSEYIILNILLDFIRSVHAFRD